MPDEDEEASELDEAKKVFNVIFPSRDQSAVVLHPGKDPFDLPAATVAAQWASILRLLPAIASIRRDHLDAIFGHLRVQQV